MLRTTASPCFRLVRTLATLLFLLAQCESFAQPALVINELQAANRRTSIAADGSTPDWIELYNSSQEPSDIIGMRFAVVGRTHVIQESLIIAPGEHRVLWFDGVPERGVDHIGFTLPRKGGTLLLIAADGVSVQDVFTYPAMAGDLSVGRLTDGSKDWSFFDTATPGAPNKGTLAIHGRTGTPVVDTAIALTRSSSVLPLLADEGACIRYTTDGTEPTVSNGVDYNAPITIDHNMVVRARAFASGRLPSKEFCSTYHLGDAPVHGITIAMDQNGLTDDSTGINVEGALANFSRKGRTWERLAMVKFNGSVDVPIPIGISIHGSGSRGLPKRSFKLHARDRYDSPVKGLRLSADEYFQEGILRADAGAHTFLRNRFMEVLVQSRNLHVDVQPSRAMPLYLNGAYWGLYRWMPPKDAQWLERISGSQAVDVLEGPAGVVRSGSDDLFKPAVQSLLALAPLDSLERRIDIDNLIDLACLDLWTGRADHDLNVRCYRPRQHDGRWRWVMFDMDLWAPAFENSTERMASGAAAETPYIPQLLGHTALQAKLLARMSALLATALSATSAGALADSLFQSHRMDLVADHLRWQAEMERPDPGTSYNELKRFTAERPTHLLRHLSSKTGHKLRNVSITAPRAEEGVLLLEGLALAPGEQLVTCFANVPMSLEAIPTPGHTCTGWKGVDGSDTRVTVDLSRLRSLRPQFAPIVP